MTAQPSTTMLVYLLNVAASSATKPASPTQVLRLVLASAASTTQSRAPVPAAISEASVKVGMSSRQANRMAAPDEQYSARRELD